MVLTIIHINYVHTFVVSNHFPINSYEITSQFFYILRNQHYYYSYLCIHSYKLEMVGLGHAYSHREVSYMFVLSGKQSLNYYHCQEKSQTCTSLFPPKTCQKLHITKKKKLVGFLSALFSILITYNRCLLGHIKVFFYTDSHTSGNFTVMQVHVFHDSYI